MDALRKTAAWLLPVAGLAAYFVFGAMHLSPWAASWDEVDFALALDRFDLLSMQPHAPGYPYFVFGGRLMAGFADSPVLALGLWNLILTCSSAWPLYRIARRWATPAWACFAAAAVMTIPLNWTLAVRPMSEGAALALLWWFLWALVRLSEKPSNGKAIAAAFFFGLLMGTRLSYAPFGLGLLLAAWKLAGDRELPVRIRAGRLILWTGAAAGFQLLWVAAVAAAEGGLAGTLRLFAGFGEGHFTEWGGGAAQAGVPAGERVLRFFGDNWLWTGVFARSYPAAAAAGVLILALLIRLGRRPAAQAVTAERLRRFLFTPAGMLVACAAAYAVWALLGQNIAKFRHAAPLASLSVFPLMIAAANAMRRPRATALLAVVLLVFQTAAGVGFVIKQQDEPPAVYGLAETLSRLPPDSRTVVYTWEEERVLHYLQVPVQTRPIFTYEYFLANLEAEPDARILLTGSVWEAFRMQKDLPDSQVTLLGEFRSDDRLDPVYGTIKLYEWNRPGRGIL